jgi:hypothetical protein
MFFVNDGGGTFTHDSAEDLLTIPISDPVLEAADFDGDGDADLVAAGFGSPTHLLLTNSGGLSFSTDVYEAGFTSTGLDAGELRPGRRHRPVQHDARLEQHRRRLASGEPGGRDVRTALHTDPLQPPALGRRLRRLQRGRSNRHRRAQPRDQHLGRPPSAGGRIVRLSPAVRDGARAKQRGDRRRGRRHRPRRGRHGPRSLRGGRRGGGVAQRRHGSSFRAHRSTPGGTSPSLPTPRT